MKARSELSDADYVGRGISLPVRADTTSLLDLVGGDDELIQSIRVILGTRPGERVMRPEFGCAVWDYLFAPLNDLTLGSVQDAVAEALGRWEPRIIIDRVFAEAHGGAEPGRIDVVIDYRVSATNSPRNLVYPFYTIPAEERP